MPKTEAQYFPLTDSNINTLRRLETERKRQIGWDREFDDLLDQERNAEGAETETNCEEE